jgi:hypothetical protein
VVVVVVVVVMRAAGGRGCGAALTRCSAPEARDRFQAVDFSKEPSTRWP